MKSLFIFITVYCLSHYSILHAQNYDFDLSDYRLPEIERHALDLNIYFNGNFGQDKYHRSSDYYNTNNRSTSGNIVFEYSALKNNALLQNTQRATLAMYFGYAKNKINSEDRYYNDWGKEDFIYDNLIIDFKFDNEWRWYQLPDKYFGFLPFAGFQFIKDNSHRKYISDGYISEYTDKFRTHQIRLFAPVELGFGRIEPVNDFRHAIYIVEALEEENRLAGKVADADILELAALISELKDKRFFDARLHRIEELQRIHEFLQSQQMLKLNDAAYFATLTDIWAYGNLPFRASGLRIAALLGPGYNHIKGKSADINKYGIETYFNEYVTTNESRYESFDFTLGLRFAYEIPANLYWQHSLLSEIAYTGFSGSTKDIESGEEPDIDFNIFSLSASHRIGYYPNTRTDFFLEYGYQFMDLGSAGGSGLDKIKVNGEGVRLFADLGWNYYIMPQLTLELNYIFSYQRQNSDDELILALNGDYGKDFPIANFNHSPSDFNFYYYYDRETDHVVSLSLSWAIF
jgi:hypothetical protein